VKPRGGKRAGAGAPSLSDKGSVEVSVRMEPDLLEKVDAIGRKRGQKRSSLIRQVLRDFVARNS
jgi:metal-responsive CopG/Arc/MetJ family transcriptional regulator